MKEQSVSLHELKFSVHTEPTWDTLDAEECDGRNHSKSMENVSITVCCVKGNVPIISLLVNKFVIPKKNKPAHLSKAAS